MANRGRIDKAVWNLFDAWAQNARAKGVSEQEIQNKEDELSSIGDQAEFISQTQFYGTKSLSQIEAESNYTSIFDDLDE